MLKNAIRDALRQKDFGRITQLALGNKKVFSVLVSLAYDKEDVLCWRAIEAMGSAAGAVAAEDPSSVRTIVQRLLWTMRDEAGGIGWSSAEMLGEIVRSTPETFRDIPPIILSFHEEEMFLGGVLWSVGRLVEAGIALDGDAAELVVQCLGHEDPQIRGLAVLAASRMRIERGKGKIAGMIADGGHAMIYEDRELHEKTVGAIAAGALELLQERKEYLTTESTERELKSL